MEVYGGGEKGEEQPFSLVEISSSTNGNSYDTVRRVDRPLPLCSLFTTLRCVL